jgi:hypothetical protein
VCGRREGHVECRKGVSARARTPPSLRPGVERMQRGSLRTLPRPPFQHPEACAALPYAAHCALMRASPSYEAPLPSPHRPSLAWGPWPLALSHLLPMCPRTPPRPSRGVRRTRQSGSRARRADAAGFRVHGAPVPREGVELGWAAEGGGGSSLDLDRAMCSARGLELGMKFLGNVTLSLPVRPERLGDASASSNLAARGR